MEINDVKTIDYSTSYTSSQSTGESSVRAEGGAETETNRNKPINGTKEKKELTKEEIDKGNYFLNKFMESINSDIQFIYHEKAQRMMVQVVDMKDKKVLKEFPPHELLDIMANIREYVGILLDKKV